MSIKKLLKSCTRILSDEAYVKLNFIRQLHCSPDLKNPKTFNEKLEWLKLYNHVPEYSKLADKLSMRDYVKDKIGPDHTVPVLGIWDSFDEIDFSSLPHRFVLKCNHNSGYYAICRDKESFDVGRAQKTINERLKSNYYY